MKKINWALTLVACGIVAGCSSPDQPPPPQPPPAAEEAAVEDLGTYEGNLEVVSSSGVVGWVWDTARPDAPIGVEVLVDHSPVAKVKADKARQDLVKEKKGNGQHGFLLPTPWQAKDGQTHTLTVRIAETKTVFGNKTQTLPK